MILRRGWSIVELVVVIAIVALMTSLLLPAMSGVTASGRRTACLATIRSTAQSVHAYAKEWDDAVPGLPPADAPPGGPDEPRSMSTRLDLPPSMGGDQLFLDYFAQGYLVNLLLELGGAGPAHQFTCPSHPQGELRVSAGSTASFGTYTLPESFAADPLVFDPQSPVTPGPANAKTQRMHNVGHPSLKVLLFERRLFHERGWWSFADALEPRIPVPTALADGHAVLARYPWPARIVTNRLAGREAYEPMATRNGVAGRDAWEAGG